MSLKTKILAATLSLAIILTSSTPTFATNQNIKIKQKVNKHGIKQKIIVRQLGDLNQALVDATINAFIPNPHKNFKISQKIKIKQKGADNSTIVNPSIIATLGEGIKRLSVKQKINIKQKGDNNSATTNPNIYINQ